MKYSNRSTPFLDTTTDELGQPRFEVHQDGSAGRTRRLPATAAEATVLSSVTTAAEFPHLYALREELRSLRFLQLDPAAERRPSDLNAPETLLPDGSNLAAVLFRIQAETAESDQPKGALVDILADLSGLISGIVDIAVKRDDERREYRLTVTVRDGQSFSSRVVSDGTLRMLALLTLLHDPRGRGVVCFEEPENGVNKSRLQALMRLLRDACTEPSSQDVDPEESLLQMIVNTHSPVVARALPNEIALADMVEVIDPSGGSTRRATRLRPYKISEQAELDFDQPRRRITPFELERLVDLNESSEFAA